jgi:hypothetical protein
MVFIHFLKPFGTAVTALYLVKVPILTREHRFYSIDKKGLAMDALAS